jgi:adenine-specific DNA-methyltransferase
VEIDKEKKEAKISPIKKGNEQVVLINELLVVRRFGEPTYSVFTPVGSVKKNDDKPYNIAINGENYHALQLLNYLLEKQVDLIYIDPPYNTGVKDWKYNNCYVDSNDSWRRALACP